jgi:hypothetical protein
VYFRVSSVAQIKFGVSRITALYSAQSPGYLCWSNIDLTLGAEILSNYYWLVARDKPGLFVAMLRALVGDAAYVSFEGDLSRCTELFSLFGATSQESDTLKRKTVYPLQDFVIVPMESASIHSILEIVLPEARIVHDIIHVQIEKDGRLAFGAYDNFHKDCIVAWSELPLDLLADLRTSGVLRSYEFAPLHNDA